MTNKQLETRLKVFAYVLVGIFFIILARLWYMQIIRGEHYSTLAEGNRIRRIPVTAPRGIFYDRNGEPLVSSRLSFTVSILPTALTENREEVYEELAEIIGISSSEIKQEVEKSANRPFEPVRLLRDASPEIVTKIEERRLDLPGVIVEEMPVRNYIYGEFASHLFGYLGKISEEELVQWRDEGYRMTDVVGKTGLERVYEKYLKGQDGGEQVEVDAAGRPISLLGFANPVPGNDLLLTIDHKVQLAAEEALDQQLEAMAKSKYPNAKAGSVVVLDVETGQVLAMASKPGYDPNSFVGGISSKELEEMLKNPYHPFTSRVLRVAEPPGSIFKLITATAALETGKVTLHDRFYCTGKDRYGKRCWRHSGHGQQTLLEGIKNSCNIVFYELGRRVGIDELARYARMYGLGKPTGFELPGERAGLVPDRQWKRENFKRADNQIWYEAETMDVAIGQGALQTTPLQMASAIAAIGNGGTIYRPYVVQKVLSPEGEELKSFQPVATGQLQVSPDTLAVLRQGMQDVTDPGGTAYGAFAGFPVAVGGKTGTAQNSQGDDHAWFVALAPIEDPEVAIVVFIEQGGSGGGFAAPVARKVLASYFNVEQKEEQAAQKASSQGAENESDGGQTPSQEQSAPEEEPQAQELPSDVPALPPSNNTSPEEQEEAEQLDEG
ncbi:MAG: penicillin-binding protein 2 [Firmicutes bacterium]|nr:penicillin-binding protein 2 [Bacillota bacterium]